LTIDETSMSAWTPHPGGRQGLPGAFGFTGKIAKVTLKLGPTQLTSLEQKLVQYASARANN